MPAMADPHFAKTLTLICEHNDRGALGVVVNRPIDMNVHTLLEQIEAPSADEALKTVPVHYGGPVQMDRGFVLHMPLGQWQSSLAVGDDLGLTTSKDILDALARGEGPKKLLVTLGYAGWAPGQLEHEMAQNAWLTVAADPGLIFDLPAEQRFPAAMALLGINPAMLSDDAGHA